MNVLSRFLSTLLAPERQRRFVVVLIMAVVLSNLLAIGLGVFSLIGSRAQTEALVAQNARNLAGALDQGLANSGRTIDLALRALGIGPGDRVLTNAFTLAPVPGAIASR